MDILIKNMVLPKQCANCRFCWVDWGERICLIGGIDVEKHYLGKNPTCPLVALPEHGDLIDRDKLLKLDNISYVDTGYWSTDYEAVKTSVIKKAPTIVEANNE